ncbi:hypothetical protein OR571_13620 [Psychrobacillus sp. NEAU-3TGS]|uniref:5' nucleotidase, NT5C type n=1 Tax=Psychrobacillus sp. NEAU-3TGS TaxID=2995412 RepID=UPI0024990AA8|nr:hypothetical protein [Psychrobacillus sp. NEAU-3TGS]MDI2588127.1 hypothetical protein [Psychrobacillus sp. NEAU-3TGS]
MTNIRFGIDIDGTVTCPTSLLPHINEAFKCNLQLSDIKEYDLTKAFPVNEIEFYEWFKKSEATIYATSPIQPDAHAVLSAWKEKYELYFISARGENVMDVTLNWFKEQELLYDHIELIGTHNKIETARKHGVHVFFEDKHDNAVEINEELKIPVLLFNTPYNQQAAPKGVIRVNNWIEANNWIEKEFALSLHK